MKNLGGQTYLQNGITLIALVVTIIVLLILAGISINMLTGQNGILTRAEEAKVKTDLAQIEEQVNLKILEQITLGGGNGENTNIQQILKDMGVNCEPLLEDENITDIEIIGSKTLNVNENKVKMEVKYIGEEGTSNYYIIQNGLYYKIEKNGEGIKIAKTSTKVGTQPKKLVATSNNTNVIVKDITEKEILLNTGDTVGNATITVKYGDNITKDYDISVVKKPKKDVADPILSGNVTFNKDFGRVEVVWLKGKTNEISSTPNVPLRNEGTTDPNPLKPVTWDYYENGYKLDSKGKAVPFSTLEEAKNDTASLKDVAGNIIQWKENTRAETEQKQHGITTKQEVEQQITIQVNGQMLK